MGFFILKSDKIIPIAIIISPRKHSKKENASKEKNSKKKKFPDSVLNSTNKKIGKIK